MKRGPALGTLFLSAAVADASVKAIRIAKAHPKVSPMLKDFLGAVLNFPIGALIFGLAFGIGCAIALRPRTRIGATEIVSGVVFCVAGSIICTYAAGFIGSMALADYELLRPLVAPLLIGFCLALIARIAYSLEIHPVSMVIVAIIAAALRLPQVTSAVPFGLAGYWLTWVGTTIALLSINTFR